MVSTEERVKAYPENNYFVLNRQADGSITAGAVVADGSTEIEVAEATASDNPSGVALPQTTGGSEDHSDGDNVAVVINGVVRLEASGSISEGEKVKTAAGGAVQSITGDGTDSANLMVGRALEGAADGETLEVKLE
jgi:hypothetical protein